MSSIEAPPIARWTNEPAVPAADDRSILDRWDRVVALYPDADVLAGVSISGAESTPALTYREMDRLTEALAHTLEARLGPDDSTGPGVGPVPGDGPVPVGVMAGHTVEAVLAMVSLIKAGRLVVMLDVHLPEARLEHIAHMAGLRDVVVAGAHRELADGIVADGTTILPFEALMDEARAVAGSDAVLTRLPAAACRGEQDGVVIVFTSGSTGMPKGVVVSHRALLMGTETDSITVGHEPGDHTAVVLPLSFIAGSGVAISAMLAGSAIVLIDPRDTGTNKLLDWIVDEKISGIVATPHLLRSLVGALDDDGDDRLRGPRWVCTVGEAVTGTDVAAARPWFGARTTFYNGFGSSEMSGLTLFDIRWDEPIPEGIIPAGYLTPGRSVIILREDGTEAPVGETGELIAVSKAITPGYWGDHAQTASRLGHTEDGTPTWRQGDLARVMPDGQLMLAGRADDAVKVRGYLVEPSEIEAAMRKIDGVGDVLVTAHVAPPAATRLVAYVAGKPGRRTPAPAAVRRELRAQLPEYMVPATIVPVVELPRNERGKVDRSRLPDAPSVEVEMTELEYDQWELVVGQIWAEVLGLRGVGLDEDFSALGGDSLTAEEMLALVQERLGVDLRASELLEHPTLREFAHRVHAGTTALPSHPDIVKVATATGSTKPPVFCVAGSGALALTFLPLSRRLPGHDVYAFQQHGLEGWGKPDWSVEQMAKRFIALMRIAQPRGPYLLVGHSLGGLVALQMAQVLRENGEEVEQLVLLDTFMPRTRVEQGALEFGRLHEVDQKTGLLPSIGRAVDKGIRRVLPSGIPYGEVLGRRVRAYGAGVVPFRGQQHFDAMFDQGGLAARQYQIRPYGGAVTYVVADNNPDMDVWQPMLQGQTNVARIKSEHSSLLREPHVTELAQVLRVAFGDE